MSFLFNQLIHFLLLILGISVICPCVSKKFVYCIINASRNPDKQKTVHNCTLHLCRNCTLMYFLDFFMRGCLDKFL